MEFTKCCGCVNLKTGCLIIGYLHLVLGICEFFTFATYFGEGISQLSEINSPEWLEVMPVCVVGVHTLLTFISICFTVGLVCGIHKNVERYIHMYIVYNAMFLVLHVFDFLFFFMFRSNYNEVAFDIFYIFLTVYFLLVIKSYWTQLKYLQKTQSSDQTSPPPYSEAVTYPPVGSHATAPAVYSETTEKPPIY